MIPAALLVLLALLAAIIERIHFHYAVEKHNKVHDLRYKGLNERVEELEKLISEQPIQ